MIEILDIPIPGNDLIRTKENDPAFGEYESTSEESPVESFLSIGMFANHLPSQSATKRR